jgi:hypothetical protein
MAFVYGARAYNSSDLRKLAEHVWNDAVVYQISSENAAQGIHPMRNKTYKSTCNDREHIHLFNQSFI